MVAQYRKKEFFFFFFKKSNCGFNDFSIYSLYWIHLILAIWEKVGFKKKRKYEDLNRRFGIGDLMGMWKTYGKWRGEGDREREMKRRERERERKWNRKKNKMEYCGSNKSDVSVFGEA